MCAVGVGIVGIESGEPEITSIESGVPSDEDDGEEEFRLILGEIHPSHDIVFVWAGEPVVVAVLDEMVVLAVELALCLHLV